MAKWFHEMFELNQDQRRTFKDVLLKGDEKMADWIYNNFQFIRFFKIEELKIDWKLTNPAIVYWITQKYNIKPKIVFE
jgi:hypothetical protein